MKRFQASDGYKAMFGSVVHMRVINKLSDLARDSGWLSMRAMDIKSDVKDGNLKDSFLREVRAAYREIKSALSEMEKHKGGFRGGMEVDDFLKTIKRHLKNAEKDTASVGISL